MSPGPVVVVTGQPAVGKSTICATLAARRDLAAHVKADDLHRMIVSGGEWPSSGTAPAHSQLLARTRNAAQVAYNLAATGVHVFIDEVVALPEQVEILDTCLGPAHWVVLTASLGTISERDASRGKHTAAAYLNLGVDIVDLVAERAAIVVNTDALDPQQTSDAVDRALDAPAHEPDAHGEVWWLVEVTVAPEQLEGFEALTLEMLDAARDEAGTLAYERYQVDDTTFHFHERYESARAAIQHLERFGSRFAGPLSAAIHRTRFHLYGPVTPQLRAALAPIGAIPAHRWPSRASSIVPTCPAQDSSDVPYLTS